MITDELTENMDIADTDNSGAFSITASDILEFLYCPRFTYFENYLDIPQHEEKRFKSSKRTDDSRR